ncbi:MAG: NUDIX hydrolase [Ignavibacteria bacterium]|nr:NUDIX hydrolase [Ignavibacteria bacterium]
MIEHWTTSRITKIGDFKIFTLFEIERNHPTLLDKRGEFYTLETASWVNIIPITRNNTVVFVQQYRHGIDRLTLEVPGGLVEIGENPLLAGMRECLEETGYASTENAHFLGETLPNPAFLNNSCYCYVWHNCEKISAQALDGNEDIRVIEVPLAEIPTMILSGEIQHSLVLSAFLYYWLRYGMPIN